jgi:hypothetical protein
MSATLAISLNVVADLMIIGLLALVMLQARRLTPHAGASGEAAGSHQTRPSERQHRARKLAGASAALSPAR